MAPPCKAFAAAWVVRAALLQCLVDAATAGEEEMLAIDDECRAGDGGCVLSALQRRGAARADPGKADSESVVEEGGKPAAGSAGAVSVDGYQMFPHWNCYKPGAPSDDGYVGVVSVSTCAELCNNRFSCNGFVYMRSQSKCWLRSSGYRCFRDTTGEGAYFDYYQKYG